MRRFFLSVIFVYCSLLIFSQTPETNLNKYWYYRDRLKYFVMPGTEPGQSILFSRRNTSINTQWDGTEYTMDIDQPRMMMGLYIDMLATRCKLLKDNGQTASASEMLTELNQALDAFADENLFLCRKGPLNTKAETRVGIWCVNK